MNKQIMIVKKTDLAGTSTKHISIPENHKFKDAVYMEVTAQELKKRGEQYWTK